MEEIRPQSRVAIVSWWWSDAVTVGSCCGSVTLRRSGMARSGGSSGEGKDPTP